VLYANAAAGAKAQAEERTEFSGAAVRVGRSDRLAIVPIRRKRAHQRLGVPSGQRGLVAADDVPGVGGPALENGRPEVALSVDRPSAEIGAEHHRPIVGRLGDDRYRPGDFSPGVIGQMRQKFDHSPVPDDAGGDGLDTSARLASTD
jgi:hypothetical protein